MRDGTLRFTVLHWKSHWNLLKNTWTMIFGVPSPIWQRCHQALSAVIKGRAHENLTSHTFLICLRDSWIFKGIIWHLIMPMLSLSLVRWQSYFKPIHKPFQAINSLFHLSDCNKLKTACNVGHLLPFVLNYGINSVSGLLDVILNSGNSFVYLCGVLE